MASGTAVVLVARVAVGQPGVQEIEELARRCLSIEGVTRAMGAFFEQGEPSLPEALARLHGEGHHDVLVIPLFLPLEPGIVKAMERAAQAAGFMADGPAPAIRIVRTAIAQSEAMSAVLADAVARAREAARLTPAGVPRSEGSIVHAYQKRLLVCTGAPCCAAGSADVWMHLRREHARLQLRTTGGGTGIARTSCLGPCSLAPVAQVYPEGVLYGGVGVRDVDRIIQEHLLGGEVVADLVYAPSSMRQRLRDERRIDTPAKLTPPGL